MLARSPERSVPGSASRVFRKANRNDPHAAANPLISNILEINYLDSIFWRETNKSVAANLFCFNNLTSACKKKLNRVFLRGTPRTTFLKPGREDSEWDASERIHLGSGARPVPSAGTSGRRTLDKRGRDPHDGHSPGRCSNLSTGAACGGTRRLRHSRDSVRPLLTFPTNSPSPLCLPRSNPIQLQQLMPSSSCGSARDMRNDSVSSQLRLNRKVDTKVIPKQKGIARKLERIPRWCTHPRLARRLLGQLSGTRIRAASCIMVGTERRNTMATKYRVIKVKGAKPETFIVVGIDFGQGTIISTSESMPEVEMRTYLKKAGASEKETNDWIAQARTYPS
jgi:hypothetical protein